jgi:dihydroflavonol-4-reductase
MKCFVTGASGFIGSHLVHALLARKHRVKALMRPGSDRRGLAGAEVEVADGDLGNRELLRREMQGCDWCFHCAAAYQLWMRNYAPMYAANVAGTHNVLEAAGDAGCARIIYTSTVGCIGLPKIILHRTEIYRQPGKWDKIIEPTDETAPVAESQMTNHYKRSKWEAETIAVKFARDGLPVVIVNPSAPVGPGDLKPTPTGKIIVDFLNRKLPAYLETGLNWVHVRDVAVGHILAAEKGAVGQRYILGNADGNWTMAETLCALQELTGIPAPKIKIPHWVALAAAHVSEPIAALTGKPPKAPLAGVRMAKYKMWFSPAKAIRDLGLPQTPPKQAFTEAVEWFRKNGYVKA